MGLTSSPLAGRHDLTAIAVCTSEATRASPHVPAHFDHMAWCFPILTGGGLLVCVLVHTDLPGKPR